MNFIFGVIKFCSFVAKKAYHLFYSWYSKFTDQEIIFEDLNIPIHVFNSLFTLHIDGLQHNLLECLIIAYILYERYMNTIKYNNNLSQQSKINIFFIAYILGNKILNDVIDMSNKDFIHILNLDNMYLPILCRYENIMCSVLDWNLYIDRCIYLKHLSIMSDVTTIQKLVIEPPYIH